MTINKNKYLTNLYAISSLPKEQVTDAKQKRKEKKRRKEKKKRTQNSKVVGRKEFTTTKSIASLSLFH